MPLWLASGNPKKCLELTRVLTAHPGIELFTLADLPEPITIVEDRPDFAGNAALKAQSLAVATGQHAIGDDSGLVVDALDGRPGVHSARYAGPDATDADRIAKLLGELGPTDRRTARFVCHLALAGPDGSLLATFEASCEGSILRAPTGTGGFGYDPVFAAAEFAEREPVLSFAELTAEQKDLVSHRGKALRQLAAHLSSHPLQVPS